MFSRAKDQAPAAKQSRSALVKQLFPSSSPGAPAGGDLRDQFRKMNSATARDAQPASVGGGGANPARPAKPGPLQSLYDNSDSFKPTVMEPAANAAFPPAVDFGEDDFSDDENLDLDYQAPQSLPPLGPSARQDMPPPASSAHSETGIPWTSSPANHLYPPKVAHQQPTFPLPSLKRESSGDNDELDLSLKTKAKKRVLPANFRRSESEVMEMPRGDVVHSKTAAFWDSLPDAADKQKKLSKEQRNQLIGDMRGLSEERGAPTPAKVVPITLSSEQLHVLDLVVDKGKSVFFTGPAGTGKSVLMKAIIRKLKDKWKRDPERVAVTASTGLAACNIGGITLHSFSGIGLGKEDASVLVKKIKRNPKARKRWEKTKVLIIDEVSMVDGALFDKLSQIGRTMRNNGRPWGGIQLVITGDFFQLPPVPDRDNQEPTLFSFDAATWSTSIDHTIGLTQVFRQRDPKFASMLNELRLGKISPETETAFHRLSRPLNFDDGVDSAQLYPTRAQVESSNEARLRNLPGQVHRYEAMDAGDPALKDKLLSNMMAPKSLDLKIDSQVMLIKNLDDTLVNGSLGKVIAFSDENTFEMKTASPYGEEMEDDMAKARRKLSGFSHDGATPVRDGRKYPVVRFISTGGKPRVILCQPEEWKVELPNGEVQAKRNQLPLILAWALSIHKAQGQTLERVTVDLGRVFENGQAYVALSRATTQDGLRVLGFKKSKVMAHQRVIEFYGKLYSAEQAVSGQSAAAAKPVRSLEPRALTRPPQTGTTSAAAIDLDDDEEALASWG